MATYVKTSQMLLVGSSWTGTAPGPGNPTPSGTISSSTDFSDHVAALSLDFAGAEQDFTNFGSGGYTETKIGLLSASLTVDMFQDFASSTVDSVMYGYYSARTLVYLDVKPTSSARGSTNPSYVVAAYITAYPAIGGNVGDASKSQITFKPTGAWARLTS